MSSASFLKVISNMDLCNTIQKPFFRHIRQPHLTFLFVKRCSVFEHLLVQHNNFVLSDTKLVAWKASNSIQEFTVQLSVNNTRYKLVSYDTHTPPCYGATLTENIASSTSVNLMWNIYNLNRKRFKKINFLENYFSYINPIYVNFTKVWGH